MKNSLQNVFNLAGQASLQVTGKLKLRETLHEGTMHAELLVGDNFENDVLHHTAFTDTQVRIISWKRCSVTKTQAGPINIVDEVTKKLWER